MSRDISLENVSEGKEEINDIPPEELREVTEKFNTLKGMVDQGYEMTLDDMRLVVQYNRAIRTHKFCVRPAKVEKEKKPKKLARVRMLELFLKRSIGVTLSEEDERNLEHSLKMYKGKKLALRDLNILLLRERDGEELNEIEQKDKQRTLFPPE